MHNCSVCKLKKPNKLFPKHSYSPSGYNSYCKECANKLSKKYYSSVKEKRKQQFKDYYQKNREYLVKKNSRQTTKRRQTNIQVRIAANLRRRINHIIKGQNKNGSAVKDLGCSLFQLQIHLEKQFSKGMTWENYGIWHIDHIKPLSLFNLLDREEFLQACNYKNLQPLWGKDNLAKKAQFKESKDND